MGQAASKKSVKKGRLQAVQEALPEQPRPVSTDRTFNVPQERMVARLRQRLENAEFSNIQLLSVAEEQGELIDALSNENASLRQQLEEYQNDAAEKATDDEDDEEDEDDEDDD